MVDVKKSDPNDGFHIPYGNRHLLKALELLLEVQGSSEGYGQKLMNLHCT